MHYRDTSNVNHHFVDAQVHYLEVGESFFVVTNTIHAILLLFFSVTSTTAGCGELCLQTSIREIDE